MNKTIITLSIIVAFALGIVVTLSTHKTVVPEGIVGSVGETVYYGTGTNTAVLCQANTSTLAVASSTSRLLTRIGNDSSHTIYLAVGGNAANDTGITVAASSSVEFSPSNTQYGGAIFCIGGGTSATATITTLP